MTATAQSSNHTEFLRAHGWHTAGISSVTYEQAKNKRLDVWVPACGGTETEFRSRNLRLLYCFNFHQQRHAYINLDTDTLLTPHEADIALGIKP